MQAFLDRARLLGADEHGQVGVAGDVLAERLVFRPLALAQFDHSGRDDDAAARLELPEDLDGVARADGVGVEGIVDDGDGAFLAELEAVLLMHPAVADAAVVPLADEEAGEIPKGFVVMKPGTDTTAVTPQSLMNFVAGQVASYKQIRQLDIIDAIPKSPSGKILRRLLRAREQAT